MKIKSISISLLAALSLLLSSCAQKSEMDKYIDSLMSKMTF